MQHSSAALGFKKALASAALVTIAAPTLAAPTETKIEERYAAAVGVCVRHGLKMDTFEKIEKCHHGIILRGYNLDKDDGDAAIKALCHFRHRNDYNKVEKMKECGSILTEHYNPTIKHTSLLHACFKGAAANVIVAGSFVIVSAGIDIFFGTNLTSVALATTSKDLGELTGQGCIEGMVDTDTRTPADLTKQRNKLVYGP